MRKQHESPDTLTHKKKVLRFFFVGFFACIREVQARAGLLLDESRHSSIPQLLTSASRSLTGLLSHHYPSLHPTTQVDNRLGAAEEEEGLDR